MNIELLSPTKARELDDRSEIKRLKAIVGMRALCRMACGFGGGRNEEETLKDGRWD